MSVLDIFAGAGGLSLGLEAAGFNVTSAVEWDADACVTFAKAHPAADVYEGDIDAMSFRHLRDSIEVVAGGPPCQPWSSGGKRLGAGDPRDGWPAFLRVLEEVRPYAFLAENVSGFAGRSGHQAFAALLAELETLGYRTTWQVLNAADFGVPQKRLRLLIVGLKSGSFEFPAPSDGAAAKRKRRTAGEVLGPEPIGEPNPAIVTYAKAPDLRPSPSDGHIFNGGGRPIDLTVPAPTLLASMGGNKTPWLDTHGVVPGYHAHLARGGQPRSGRVPGARRITVQEAAALQTFPAGMEFAGKRSSCYRQIGNAVPPLLAEAVGRRLVEALSPT